jgi:hypothetical protein
MRRRWLLFALSGLACLIILAGVAYTLISTRSAPAPHTWVTTHTFSGQGSKQTPVFHAGDDWRFTWTCSPVAGKPVGYTLFLIDVDKANTMYLDPSAVNITCVVGSATGSVVEHQGGNIYLDVGITTDGKWTVEVQEHRNSD